MKRMVNNANTEVQTIQSLIFQVQQVFRQGSYLKYPLEPPIPQEALDYFCGLLPLSLIKDITNKILKNRIPKTDQYDLCKSLISIRNHLREGSVRVNGVLPVCFKPTHSCAGKKEEDWKFILNYIKIYLFNKYN